MASIDIRDDAAMKNQDIGKLLIRAMSSHGAGRDQEAEELYRRVLRLAPMDPTARFNLGAILHERGERIPAIASYRMCLDVLPNHFPALMRLGAAYSEEGMQEQAMGCFQQAHALRPDLNAPLVALGVSSYQAGRPDEAEQAFRRVLEQDETEGAAFYNLGIIAQDRGDLEEAVALYRTAAKLLPNDADAHFNLGLTLHRLGRYGEAIEAYEQALAAGGPDTETFSLLGAACRRLQQPQEAMRHFTAAVELDPDNGKAWLNLGICLHALGMNQEAEQAYEKARELEHGVEAMEHLLAALRGESRDAAPEEYVRSLFDHYARDFDHDLRERLEYRVPELLRSLLDQALPGKRFSRVLDLGCGTGLSGQAFRDVADELTGVDLSPRMLDIAREKKIYDHLAAAEIHAFLRENTILWDLCVAADVLVYIGRLDSLFTALKQRLVPGGYMLFSVERCETGEPFRLQVSGRFAYSREYLDTMARTHGMETVLHRSEPIRREREEWITGDLYLLRNSVE